MTVARRHDPEASRAAILAAAETVFLAHGFAGASMSDIARASGVTKSLIHHHFGSKEALWREVKRRRFAEYHAQQMLLFRTEQPSAELLRRSMEAYFRFLADNPATLRMMSWLQLEDDRDLSDMVVELRDAGIERIEQAQRAGIVRDDLPATFVLIAFLGIVQAFFSDPARGSETAAQRSSRASAYLRDAWTIFSTGIASRTSRT